MQMQQNCILFFPRFRGVYITRSDGFNAEVRYFWHETELRSSFLNETGPTLLQEGIV